MYCVHADVVGPVCVEVAQESMKSERDYIVANYAQTGKPGKHAVLGADGAWMTPGWYSSKHAFTTWDLERGKIVSLAVIEKEVIQVHKSGSYLTQQGNYDKTASSRGMEGAGLRKTLNTLHDVLQHTTWFITDGDASVGKIFNESAVKDLVDDKRLRLGRDLGHYRKKLTSNLKLFFGNAPKVKYRGFTRRMVNWIMHAIVQGKEKKWSEEKVHRFVVLYNNICRCNNSTNTRSSI